ncbi:DUF4837 family protein [Bacteroides sp. OttesenSCG-928-D19]|nr:DUF4837 family protein [Bacteroides sp. OttesenSCG-928-N06]MDL2303818.1 DUF4837 family protein [Bacteroides sp. OttesenSCG-928-D19]
MKKNFLYFGLLIVLMVVSSCKDMGFKPSSSGRPYEIIVVVDLDLWERPAGRALYDVLNTSVPGLPQHENSFKTMYTSPKNFDTTLKLIRNIVMVEVSNIYTQGKINYSNDVYATPQMVMTLQAPNEEELQKLVEENKSVIIEFFTRSEMNRQMRHLEKNHSDYISTKVAAMFDCEVWLPAELKNAKEGEDFFWASTNTATSDMNFVIYSYPYTDVRTFTDDYILNKRDSIMKVNIPGAREGMYMKTERDAVLTRPINVHGEYAFEMRGLWIVEGDMMGGPFVSHSRLDEVNKRVITAEIFIYSPDKLKRNLVRLMEASLYTLKLPGEREQVELTN